VTTTAPVGHGLGSSKGSGMGLGSPMAPALGGKGRSSTTEGVELSEE
jgi:hypothetical protein